MLRWLFGCMCSVDTNDSGASNHDPSDITYKRAASGGFFNILFRSSSLPDETKSMTSAITLPPFDIWTLNPVVMICYLIIIIMIMVCMSI